MECRFPEPSSTGIINFPSVLTRNMIQGDKAGLGGGRGPGCICMGIWERKKSKGLILQTLNWVNKPNLTRRLHTGLWDGATVLLLGFTISALHNQIHLLPAYTCCNLHTFSTLNKVKKPWITELKLQQTSCTLSSCATSASVHDMHCMVRFGPTFEC